MYLRSSEIQQLSRRVRALQMEASIASLAESVEARQTTLGRMELLIDASPVAMFTLKAEGDFAPTFVTKGVKALWGYEPEDFLHHPKFWVDRIHPEDVSAVYVRFLSEVFRRPVLTERAKGEAGTLSIRAFEGSR